MSETGRKMDVEDVLSSIRRLVSEEARTPQDTPDTADVTPKSPGDMLHDSNVEAPEKLVLTPSLRVAEAISPPPVAAELEQRIADIESLVMSEAVAATQAEIADAVDQQEPFIEADEGDPMDDVDAPALVTPIQDAAPFLETVAPQPDYEPEEAAGDATDATSEMMSALHLSMQDFARAEPPLTANLTTPPLGDDVEEAQVEEPTAIERDVFEPAGESVDFPSDSPFEAVEDAEDMPEPTFLQSAEESEVIEEPRVETVINREPPLTASGVEMDPPADDSLFEEPIDFAEDADTLLDEESLREMVSEMVRSELQGELGDRITRNVRKLVRREIYRALASRDFE